MATISPLSRWLDRHINPPNPCEKIEATMFHPGAIAFVAVAACAALIAFFVSRREEEAQAFEAGGPRRASTVVTETCSYPDGTFYFRESVTNVVNDSHYIRSETIPTTVTRRAARSTTTRSQVEAGTTPLLP